MPPSESVGYTLGLRYVIRAEYDDIRRLDDMDDCYDAEALAAWANDDCWFVVVTVECYDAATGLEVGTDVLGGVDVGWYWPGSPDTQALQCVMDNGMLDEARGDYVPPAVSGVPAYRSPADVALVASSLPGMRHAA